MLTPRRKPERRVLGCGLIKSQHRHGTGGRIGGANCDDHHGYRYLYNICRKDFIKGFD
jgi:hypothetical protein